MKSLAKDNPKKGISLIIHTRNEEVNIQDCIKSAKEIVNEVIVVDMQSSDRTIKIAKQLGAKIFEVNDEGFGDPLLVRNYGFSLAQFEWILTLDADERLPVSLHKVITKIIRDNKYDVARFPFQNILLGKWISHTGWWPDYHPRLFKKGYLYWSKKSRQIHSEPVQKGKILTLKPIKKNAIIHFNAKNMRVFIKKMMDHVGNDNFFLKNELNSENVLNYIDGQFKWRYIDQQGYLDKTHGFVMSKFMEFYWFLNFVEYWESIGYPDFIKKDIVFNHIFNKFDQDHSKLLPLLKLKLKRGLSLILLKKTKEASY